MNWVKAIKGETKSSSPLEYAAQLTETMLLGIVALRTGQDYLPALRSFFKQRERRLAIR